MRGLVVAVLITLLAACLVAVLLGAVQQSRAAGRPAQVAAVVSTLAG